MSSLSDSVDSEWSIVSNKDFPAEELEDGIKKNDAKIAGDESSVKKEFSDGNNCPSNSPEAARAPEAVEDLVIRKEDDISKAADATTMTSFISDKDETDYANESDSSDVDVLDEMAEEDISDPAMHFPNWPMLRGNSGKCSVGIMTDTVSSVASEPPKGCENCKKRIPDPLEFLSDYIDDDGVSDCYVYLSAAIFLFMMLTLVCLTSYVISALYRLGFPPSPAENLGKIESTVLACLGRHHVEALDKGDFLHFEICTDEEGDYTKFIHNNLMNKKTTAFLLEAQMKLKNGEELPKIEWPNGPNKGKEIDIPLIIRHLEYKGLLGRMVYDDTPQKLKEIREKQIAKSAFREVIREEEIVKQMQEAIDKLAVQNEQLLQQSLKDNTGQKSSYDSIEEKVQDDNGEKMLSDSESFSSLVLEMQEKIQILLEDNENLHREISSIYTNGKTSRNGFCKGSGNGMVPDEPKDDVAENIKNKEEQLDSVLTLGKQIESIHASLSEELSKLKDWNSVIKEMTSNLKNQKATDNNNDYEWSWEGVKKNMQDIISDVQNDISSKFNALNELNMTEFLREYVEDEKKNAESFLNLVNYYFKEAKDRTREIFSGKVSEEDEEDPDSTWNLWNGLHDKWTNIKGGINKIVKDVRNVGSSTGAKKPADNSPHSDRKSEDPSSMHRSRNNWLFRRAALRAKTRQPINDNKVNWFLRRKKLRDEKAR